MSEFKVGDKVRVVGTGLHPQALVGQTGVVTDTEAGDIWPYEVQFDDGAYEIFDHREIELVVDEPEDAPDYDTSGETNLTYKATDEPNYRVEALFAALQSFGPDTTTSTTARIVKRAEEFLKFLEGKND
jgi:hypothetical protein